MISGSTSRRKSCKRTYLLDYKQAQKGCKLDSNATWDWLHFYVLKFQKKSMNKKEQDMLYVHHPQL